MHLYVADQKGRSTISFYQLYFFVPKYCLIAVLLMLFLLALAVMCKLNCYTIFAVSFFLTYDPLSVDEDVTITRNTSETFQIFGTIFSSKREEIRVLGEDSARNVLNCTLHNCFTSVFPVSW